MSDLFELKDFIIAEDFDGIKCTEKKTSQSPRTKNLFVP
jgi:hypothetical protein